MPEERFLPCPRRRDRRPTHETAHREKVGNSRGPWTMSTEKAVAGIKDVARNLICVDICRSYGYRTPTMRSGSWKPTAVTEYAVRHFLNAASNTTSTDVAKLRKLALSEIELRSLADNGTIGLWAAGMHAKRAKRVQDDIPFISDAEMEQIVPNARDRRNAKRAKAAPKVWREVGSEYQSRVNEARDIALAKGKVEAAVFDAVDAALRK